MRVAVLNRPIPAEANVTDLFRIRSPFTAGFWARLAVVAALTWLTIGRPEFGAAVAYVLIYLMIAYRKPSIALMLTFAAAPFQNDLSQGSSVRFSIAEINLVLLFTVLIVRQVVDRQPIRFGPALLPVAAYFAVCAVSMCFAPHVREAVISVLQMFLYLIVAVITFSQAVPTTGGYRHALNGLLAACVLLAGAQIASPGDYVLGLHKNGIGASLSCGLIVGVELLADATGRRRRVIAAAVIVIMAGLLCSLSRGAWLAAIAGCTTIALMRGRWGVLLKWITVAAVFFAVIYARLPNGYQQYAISFDAGRENIRARLDTIDTASILFDASPLIGNGVGLRKDIDATNLVWVTLAETGILGLAAFISIHATFFVLFRRGLAAARHDPSLASLFVIGNALLVSRFAHGMVDHYWSRGALMLDWSAVGMAMGAYFEVKRRARLTGAHQR